MDGSNPATEWKGLLVSRRDAAPAESDQRLALQHQQLAVVGGRPEQSEESRLSRLCRERRRIARADCTPSACCENKKDFTLDSLMAAAYDSYLTWFEKPMPALHQSLGQHSDSESAESEDCRADRAAARWDLSLGRQFRSHVARRVLGRRNAAPRVAAAQWRRRTVGYRGLRSSTRPRINCCEALVAASDKLHRRFRLLEDAVGRHQSLPASHRRHRPSVHRRRAEHSGRLHVLAVGIARLVRRARLSRHEEMVRHQRQQLRGGGGVR